MRDFQRFSAADCFHCNNFHFLLNRFALLTLNRIVLVARQRVIVSIGCGEVEALLGAREVLECLFSWPG